MDAHYTDPRLTPLYDAECGWGMDRQFYLDLAGKEPMRILDLGCGTGLLCDAFAKAGHQVSGADPAAEMLAIARQKPRGDQIEWVQAPAQTFRHQDKFDLIVLTGHAFQVLLEDADVTAAFHTIKSHLAPGGRLVFESRIPAINWAKRWHGQTTQVFHNGHMTQIVRTVLSTDIDTISFATTYTLQKETVISRSTLRFPSRNQVVKLLAETELHCQTVLGDWSARPFQTDWSDEMIFVATAAA